MPLTRSQNDPGLEIARNIAWAVRAADERGSWALLPIITLTRSYTIYRPIQGGINSNAVCSLCKALDPRGNGNITTVFLSYLREHQTYHIRDRTRNSYLTRDRIEKQPKINHVHSVGLDQWPLDDCGYAKRALH